MNEVNISIYMMFDGEIVKEGTPQDFQAARLISGFMKYKIMLDNEEIPPEYTRDKPLCMNQYKYMFTAARIPSKDVDYIRHVSPSNTNVLVICKKQFYLLDTLNLSTRQLLSVEELQLQIKRIMKDSEISQPERGIGLLTADTRDEWSSVRHLLFQDNVNKRILSHIEECAFVVCLDDSSPVGIEEAARRSLLSDANNRWFDKVIQFVIFANGRSTLIGEHSPLDASPISEMVDYVLLSLPSSQSSSPSSSEATSNTSLPLPEKLNWQITSKITKELERAEREYNKLCSNIDFSVLHFRDFGFNYLKEHKLAPDAFIQMALQLAYFRLNNKPCPTYETAMTRQFYHGRTETCRTCSVDSVAWTKAMMSKEVTAVKKLELLKKALESHRKYMQDAVNGKGCDRHLLGLKILSSEEEHNNKTPSIFSDKSYAASCTWRLSTSSIPCSTYTPGFAAVVEDGYGICYNPREDQIRMTILCYHSCPTTNSSKMKEAIEKSFLEMKSILQSSQDLSSKL